MKEILDTMGKEDTIKFKEKIRNKKINAIEAYFDEEDKKTTVILYRHKHKKVKHLCFNEKDYFEKIRNYQAICDCLSDNCGVNVNRGNTPDRVIYFKPKQSKRLRSVIIWYVHQKRG